MEPNRSNDYQLPSWPPTALNRDLWNAVLLDIALRLKAREALEPTFEDLIEQGTQASLDYIQVNVGPQLAALQAAIEDAAERIEDIIVEGTAPNSAKLGGQLPAYFATAQALLDGLALKTDDADFEARTRAVVAELTGNAPAALDTIYELAAAIGNDPNIRQTLLNAIALKLDKAGGTVGSILVETAHPTVGLKQTASGSPAGTAYLHVDGMAIGFLDGGAQWIFRVNLATGAAWLKGIGDLATYIGTQANAARDAAIAGGSVKAWVTFNGTGTPAISASKNVSSIVDNGVGNYGINFTTPLIDTNYAVSTSANASGGAGRLSSPTATRTTSQVGILVYNVGGSPQDQDIISVMVVR